MPALDYVVRGEGEITIAELIDTVTRGGELSAVKGIAYRNGRAFTALPRKLMENLDGLPMARDLLDGSDDKYCTIPGFRLGGPWKLPVSAGSLKAHLCTSCRLCPKSAEGTDRRW